MGGSQMANASSIGGGVDEAGHGEGMEQMAVMLFGLGWLWNATTREGRGIYLNDVHILSHINSTWVRLECTCACIRASPWPGPPTRNLTPHPLTPPVAPRP